MTAYRALVLGIWGCLLAGCPPPPAKPSDDYDQAKIVQIYYVGYDAEQDSIYVTAEFYVGGLSLQLTPPSEIRHNLFALEESTGVP
ncbi:MAG: hypothetical protein ACYTF8_09830, partial [Planctomycetota bacterium]